MMYPGLSADANANWHEGGFNNPEKSLNYHFETHGEEVGASTEEEYLRKAEYFRDDLKGARPFSVEGTMEGVTRYAKNGKYIDTAPDGRIVSFGAQ